MAPRSDAGSLQDAWRALADGAGGEGWRTIEVDTDSPCRLLAGRHFPGNEEAILVGFEGVRIPPDPQLPQGQGFMVGRLAPGTIGGTHAWLTLSRRSAGSLDMFAMMAADLLRLVEVSAAAGQERLLELFLLRVRAWQDFMERHRDGVLGQEAEIGLFGEICVLRLILEMGIPAPAVLDAWKGPIDGLHDFRLGTGAIEVKTTLSANNFPAAIGSLEQLDEMLTQPLFLAAVRLALALSGNTLPELVAETRGRLEAQPGALAMFEVRLLQAGFLIAMADRYVRRFRCAGIAVLPVGGSFPRLTRSTVVSAITRARYEVDLDRAGVDDVGLACALEQLEVS